MESQECLTETGRKSRLGLFPQTLLSAGELRGIPGQKVILGLVWSQARDRRKHSRSVGGQEEHRAGVISAALRDIVVYRLNGLAGPSILGEAIVIQVDLSARLVDDDVLQHGPKVVDGLPNHRLVFRA